MSGGNPRINGRKGTSVHSLWKSGALDIDIELDIIRPWVVPSCKIYDEYLLTIKRGFNYTQAVEIIAEKLFVTERTVKRAIAAVR